MRKRRANRDLLRGGKTRSSYSIDVMYSVRVFGLSMRVGRASPLLEIVELVKTRLGYDIDMNPT